MKRILKYLVTAGLIAGAFILLFKNMPTDYWNLRLAEAATSIYPKDSMTFREVPFAFRGASVKDKDLSTDTGLSPSEGDRYIVAATGADSWLNHTGHIAEYHKRTNTDTTWYFYDPQPGYISYVVDEAEPYIFNGSSWVTLESLITGGLVTDTELASELAQIRSEMATDTELAAEVAQLRAEMSTDTERLAAEAQLRAEMSTDTERLAAEAQLRAEMSTDTERLAGEAQLRDEMATDTELTGKADTVHTHIVGDLTDYDTPMASDTRTDTTNFDNNLSSADTTVQAALETLDEMSGGGASSFHELTDVDTYVGHGGEYVKVKAGEDGIEYGTPAGAGTVTGTGTAGKMAIWTDGSEIGDGSNTDTEVAGAVTNSHTAATWGTKVIDETGIDTGKMLKYSTDAGGKWIMVDEPAGGGTVDQGDVVKIIWAFGMPITWRRRRRKMKKNKLITGLLILGLAVLSMGALAMYSLQDMTTISATPAAVFTNPAAKTTYLRLIVLHNLNTTSEVVVLYKCLAGETNADTNKFEYLTIVANDTVNLEFAGPGIILDTENDAIYARATTAGKVTIMMAGAQE